MKYILFIVCLSLITSCISCNKQNKEFEEINREKTLDIDYAYITNEKIYIQQKDNDKNILFSIKFSDITSKIKDKKIAANNIIKIKKEDLKEDDFKNNINFIKIKPITKNKWEQLIDPIISKQIIKFIPNNKNNALLVAINNKEIVIYRDENLQINYSFLYDKPKNVIITKTINNNKFNELIINSIKNNKEILEYAKHNIILFQQPIEELDYPIGIIDLKNNRIFYFDYWILYDFKKKTKDFMAGVSLLSSFIIKSHIYTIIKNPITSTEQLLFITKNKIIKAFQNENIETDYFNDENIKIENINKNENMDIDKFNEKLNKEIGNKNFKGNIQFLIDGDEYFPELIKQIESAKDIIKIRLYIFDNDDYGTTIANLLREANNERKVKVKVLMDSFANITKSIELPEIPFRTDFKQPKSMKLYLKRKSNIEVKTSPNTWITFDHVKTLIFDEEIAFMGGMNIGQEYRYSWHDLMVKLTGPIVLATSKEFDNNWAKNDLFGDIALLYQKIINKSDSKIKSAKINKDMFDIRLLYTKPGNRDIFKSQILAIKNAKNYIYIENPYIADRRIVKELIKASRRGVDIRIILPEYNNVYLMAKNNNYLINIFLKNKIKVFLYPGMTHVKASIYDGWAMIGSANFDMLSYDINKEFNIAFSDLKAVEYLKNNLFYKDFKISKEITNLKQVNIGDKFFSKIANKF